MREALKHGIREMNMSGKAKECMPLHHALTAANAVSAHIPDATKMVRPQSKQCGLCGDADKEAQASCTVPACFAREPQAQGDAELVSACRDLIAFLDKNPPMGESIWAIQRIRTALRAVPAGPEDVAIYKAIAATHPQATEPACKQLLQVPEGYTLVPVNATPEMIAAAEQVEDLYRRGTPDTWGSVYRAMLAAAPEAKQ